MNVRVDQGLAGPFNDVYRDIFALSISWGDLPRDGAYWLRCSRWLGRVKHLLERCPWQQFAPHLEWVEPYQAPENRTLASAAGIPARVRIVCFPNNEQQWAMLT